MTSAQFDVPSRTCTGGSMSKVTMPEPVAWVSHVTLKTLSRGRSVTAYPEETSWLAHGLITTDKAEAYAAAKVREALEEAAEVADRHNEFATYDAIRSLIPQENKS